MHIEHIAGVGFASRWSSEKQRELPVGLRVLGEVVIENDGMPVCVPEILSNSAPRVGSEELERMSKTRIAAGIIDTVARRYLGAANPPTPLRRPTAS